MVINSWVLYKQVCYKKKISAKDILNLAEFRTELADILCINIKPTPNLQEVDQVVALL